MGILVCTALANGLVKKWTLFKAISEKGTLSVPTSGKKSGQQMSKKGRDAAVGDQLQVGPEGSLELKEALEVSALCLLHHSLIPRLSPLRNQSLGTRLASSLCGNLYFSI